MLWIIAVLALVWGAGLFTSYTLGGFIHLLLILAVALLVVHFVKRNDRRASG